MVRNKLEERERVALEVLDALGGRATFDLIETLIRAQYRKHLRATLIQLHDQGLLNRYIPGPYEITRNGRGALKHGLEAGVAH